MGRSVPQLSGFSEALSFASTLNLATQLDPGVHFNIMIMEEIRNGAPFCFASSSVHTASFAIGYHRLGPPILGDLDWHCRMVEGERW